MKVFLNSTLIASNVRNSSILFLAWLVFFPGFFSGDSFGAVDMAKTGEFTTGATASWALFVRIFSFFGNAIGLLTLFSGLLLVFAVTQFAYAVFSKKNAALTSFIMSLTPLIWGMGITLWRDIPFTSGLLLLISFLIKIQLNQRTTGFDIASNLVLGSVLISFRPNGLPVFIIFSVLLIIFTYKKIFLKFLLIAISISSLTTLLGSNLVLGIGPVDDYFAQEWMRNDISCYAHSPKGAGFVEEHIPGIGNTEKWRSSAACTFLNQADLSRDEMINAQKYVPSAWIALAKKDPLFVLETHLNRNAYLVPIPLNGFPEPPFLHSTIEFKDQGIYWAFPSIAESARAPMRLWNLLRGITAWAGFWLATTLVMMLAFKRRELALPFLMGISLMGVLFVFAPIPDGRYAMFALITGQMAFLGKIFESLKFSVR